MTLPTRPIVYVLGALVLLMAVLWIAETCDTSEHRQRAESLADSVAAATDSLTRARAERDTALARVADAEAELVEIRTRTSETVETTTRTIHRETDAAIRAGSDLRATLGSLPAPVRDTALSQLDRIETAHAKERQAWTEQMQAMASLTRTQDSLIVQLRAGVSALEEERDRALNVARLERDRADAWEREANPGILDMIRSDLPKLAGAAAAGALAMALIGS